MSSQAPTDHDEGPLLQSFYSVLEKALKNIIPHISSDLFDHDPK